MRQGITVELKLAKTKPKNMTQKMSCRRRIYLLLVTVIVLCAFTDFNNARGREASSRPLRQFQTDQKAKPLELIAVPEDEKWLVLVAAPIAAQMKNQQKTPVIIVLSPEHAEEQRRLINQLKPLSNSCSMLSRDPDRDMFEAQQELPVRLRIVKPNLTQACILFAKTFWKKVNTAVVAPTREPEAAILASTLAAHLRVPLILYEGRRNLHEISRALNTLGVTTVCFCTNNQDENQTETSFFRQKVEFLDGVSINKRVIHLLGTNNIRNLILARVPEPEKDAGTQSWIGPYLSTMRGAPIVLCSTPDGILAEKKVKDLIMRHSLRPQTITILADYDSIGSITIKDNKDLGDYEVNVEPCSLSSLPGTAAAVGVGRIPCEELWACSNMIARGFVREFILGRNEPLLLMIANPNSEYGSLPLAEVVSRVTADEYKNFKLPVTEFYRVPTSDKRIVEAAGKANFIIYEGHISDQLMFEDPRDISEFAEQPIEYWEYSQNHQSDLPVPLENDLTFPAHNSLEVSTDDEAPICDNYRSVEDPTSDHTDIPDQNLFPNIEIQLDGLPVVILQSCHSLEEVVAQQVFKAGGVAVMGSITNIHSASGSAFVKAFCDGLLYRGDTVGEALRDARNYFLCLRSLKEQRGHREMAKVYRVALSFCLWGDPELRIGSDLPKPSRKPVSAVFVGSDTIRISTPRHRLPESRNEKYFTQMFPASQVAGIVKRLKNEEARRLMPIYFFRLPLSIQYDRSTYTKLQREGETDSRAVFLVDPLERFIYVIYFPEKETKGEVFDLRFIFN